MVFGSEEPFITSHDVGLQAGNILLSRVDGYTQIPWRNWYSMSPMSPYKGPEHSYWLDRNEMFAAMWRHVSFRSL